MQNTTQAIQSKLSEMFKELAQILDKENITYYAAGGTLLGAIRHHGFIPWDDDIDITMPRDAYDNFIQNADKLLPPHYKLESRIENENFPHFFSKIYDTRTTVVENYTQPLIRGIYIDVFPLDGITDNKHLQNKNVRKMRRYLKIYRRVFTTKVQSRTLIKRLGHYIIVPIIKTFMTKQKLISKIEALYKKNSWMESNYIVNYFGAWREKEIHPKEWYKERSLYKFDNFEVYGPREYDKVLRKLYGDYMQLPPEEKRQSHHKLQYINLNLPYTEYQTQKNH